MPGFFYSLVFLLKNLNFSCFPFQTSPFNGRLRRLKRPNFEKSNFQRYTFSVSYFSEKSNFQRYTSLIIDFLPFCNAHLMGLCENSRRLFTQYSGFLLVLLTLFN